MLPPEFSHTLVLIFLKYVYLPFVLKRRSPFVLKNPVKIAGLSFPNPIGLAAGMDKNGDCIDAWFALGFGFVELGTVTPQPQRGHLKPRLFRLKEHRALINRMGFNNRGIESLLNRLERRLIPGVLGVNIGKQRDTPLERASEDYLHCFSAVYPYVDYVTVNISSPNTPGLRELQAECYLDRLLERLVCLRRSLFKRYQRYVPLFVKISPDLKTMDLAVMLESFLIRAVDAVVVSNTSLERQEVASHPFARESGGLSGCPLYPIMKRILIECLDHLKGRLPVIAVGGIHSAEQVKEILALGASAVQIYTGLVYEGPSLIQHILNAL